MAKEMESAQDSPAGLVRARPPNTFGCISVQNFCILLQLISCLIA